MTPLVLDGYLAACQKMCAAEIERLYSPDDGASGTLFELILDYPSRGGKAVRPTLSVATCLGLGGRIEAILPTAATLELYHNAFLIHDDIEDESLLRRGRPALHVDHGIPVAINVGDAMLSLSLQPLLDNVERVGLGPALRILRAVARMTRRTVEGQAIELDWVRANSWQLDDSDYLAMVELKTSWYSFITPLQVGAIAAGARPEQLAAVGTARPAPRRCLPDHRRPAEPARRPRGLRQGDRRRPLGGQADPDAAARTAAGRAGRPGPRVADPGQAPAGRRYRASARRAAGRAGGAERARRRPRGRRSWLALRGQRHGHREEPRRHPLALPRCCDSRGRSTMPGRWPASRPTRRRRRWPPSTGCPPASTGRCSAGSSTTCTSAPDERPERRGAARPAGRAGPDPGPCPRAAGAQRPAVAPRPACRPAGRCTNRVRAARRRPASGDRQPGRRSRTARSACRRGPPLCRDRRRGAAARRAGPRRRRSTTCAASGRR